MLRSVLYVGEAFSTAVRETLGRTAEAAVCPNRRVAIVLPLAAPVVVQDFVAASAAYLGAPDDLGDGDWRYDGTQEWARAVHADRPAHPDVAGIRYWSRLDRAPDNSRSGVNIVVWDSAPPLEVPALGAIRQDFSLRHPPVWKRAVEAIGPEITLRPIEVRACGLCRRA